jgi:hypothetical protein
MGPPSYMRSVVDRNVFMWRMAVYRTQSKHNFDDFCCCSTVHFDKYQSYLWPTKAHFINIKMLKLTIKTFV